MKTLRLSVFIALLSVFARAAVYDLPSTQKADWRPGIGVGVTGGIPARTKKVDVTASPYFAGRPSTTATVTQGSTAITVADATNLKVGDPVSVDIGATSLLTKIDAINGNNVTLHDAPATTSAAATIVHDDTAAIQLAITQAVANDVVYLPARTYRVTSRIVSGDIPPKSNLTIRGDGDSTLIDFRGSDSLFAFGSSTDYYWWHGKNTDYTQNNPAGGITITGGFAQGNKTLTLASTTGLSVGQIVLIAEDNDTTLPVIEVANNKPQTRTQTAQITAIDQTAKTITLGTGLYFTLNGSLHPTLFSAGANASGIGLEDLKVDATKSTGIWLILFQQCRDSWMKNVHLYNGANYLVYLLNCVNIEIRHSNLDTLNHTGSNGSNLLMERTCASLIEDNIFYKGMPHLEVNFGSSGNVVAYNFFEHNVIASNEMAASIVDNHGPHNSHNLYEGNISAAFQIDGYFGSSSDITLFRNWFHATCDSSLPTAQLNGKVIDLNRFTRNTWIVGNVLGRPGYPYVVDALQTSTSNTNRYIYRFGYPYRDGPNFAGTATGNSWADFAAGTGSTLGSGPGAGGFPELDLDVRGTTHLIGNYNTQDNGMPATEATALGTDTLPSTFYLAAQPIWFGNLSWPAFNPTSASNATFLSQGVAAVGASPVSATVDSTTDVLTATSHGFSTGTPVGISGTTQPGGTSATTIYFANAVSANTLALYDTWDHANTGGATGKIDITSNGANVTVTRQIPAAYKSIPAGYRFVVGHDPDTAPYFLGHPSNASANPGASQSFGVLAAGFPVPAYQWREDGNPITDGVVNGVTYSGATTDTLTISGITAALQGKQYSCVITNSTAPGTATSNAATLTVNAVPVINSANVATGTYRSAFSYSITATNIPTSFSLAPGDTLPTGVTLDTSTGVISGTPTQSGTFNVTIRATNAAGTGTASLAITINKVNLTANVTAANKVYDGTNAATLNLGSTLNGVLGGDSVTINAGGATATFADAHVGTGKTVTVSGLALGGAQSANYTLTQPTTTANITRKNLTALGTLAATNKTYDTNTSVTLTGTPSLQAAITAGTGTSSDGKPYSGDTLSLSGTATGVFATKTVGTGKSVTISGLTLGGPSAGDYQLIQPTGLTANITAATLTVTGLAANNKTYNGNITATISGTGALSGVLGSDDVTLSGTAAGTFSNKTVGNAKPVSVTGLSLSGGDASNYTLTSPTLSANITQAALTVSGLTANNKVYDGTTSATLTGTAALSGLVSGDVVTLSGTATGTFADKDVGVGKNVTLAGLSASGTDAANYSFTSPTLSANITAKPLSVTGVTGTNKVYDGTTATTVSGSPVLLAAEAPAAGTGGDGKPYTGDTVSLSGTVSSAAFATATAGTAKPVSLSGLSLTGANASNYSLSATTTADITPLTLTVANIVATNKTYNGTTAATFNVAGAVLTGVLPADVANVSVSGATGTFATAGIGSAKPVTVSAVTLSGSAAGNYTVTPPTGLSADITVATLTVSGLSAIGKVFDSSTNVTFNTGAATLVGVASGDTVTIASVTGSFADAAIGANKPVTVTAITLSGASAANYTVTIPTGITASIIAPTVAPSIVTQPISQSVVAGGNITFATFALGTPTPSYQWRFNGNPIAGANSATFARSNVQPSDAGSYDVVATNSSGSATSQAATLTVNSPPTITSQPTNSITAIGKSVTFSVVATGTSPLTYQWRKDTASIAGATSSSFTIANVAMNDAAAYTVVVTNPYGSVTSTPAILTVNPNYAGTYFGTLSGGGTWALYIRADNTGTYIAYLPDRHSAIVLDLTVNADGSFSVTGSEITTTSIAAQSTTIDGQKVAAAAVSFTLTGTIANGQLSGQLSGLGQTLSGAADSGATTTAGLYKASALVTSSGTTYSIVGGSGKAFVVTTGSTAVDGATGTISADGQLAASTANGGQLSMTLGGQNQSISSTYTPAGATTPITSAGLADGVAAKSYLVNMSVRSAAGSGNNTLIAGFVVGGSAPKTLLIRGIGPTLAGFGVPGALEDPTLGLFSGSNPIASNDDWNTSANKAEIASTTTAVGAFSLSSTSKDAVILADKLNGLYSAQIGAKSGATGIALMEVYDAVPGGSAQLVNVSARTQVGTGENVLIVGFVLDGNSPRQLLIRGVGPALANFGVGGVLADPQLELYQGSSRLGRNDNWGGDATLSNAATQVGAFALTDKASKDAALLVTLTPGAYSAVVSGVNGTTGVALVEVYVLP